MDQWAKEEMQAEMILDALVVEDGYTEVQLNKMSVTKRCELISKYLPDANKADLKKIDRYLKRSISDN